MLGKFVMQSIPVRVRYFCTAYRRDQDAEDDAPGEENRDSTDHTTTHGAGRSSSREGSQVDGFQAAAPSKYEVDFQVGQKVLPNAKMSGSGRLELVMLDLDSTINLHCPNSKRGPVFATARGHLFSCSIGIRKPSQ